MNKTISSILITFIILINFIVPVLVGWNINKTEAATYYGKNIKIKVDSKTDGNLGVLVNGSFIVDKKINIKSAEIYYAVGKDPNNWAKNFVYNEPVNLTSTGNSQNVDTYSIGQQLYKYKNENGNLLDFVKGEKYYVMAVIFVPKENPVDSYISEPVYFTSGVESNEKTQGGGESEINASKKVDEIISGGGTIEQAIEAGLEAGTTGNPYNVNPETSENTKFENEYKLLAPIGGFDKINTNDIGEYFNKIFLIAIGLAGALAVIMIIIAGVQWMGTDSVFGKTEAKKQITNAVLGLLIALGSYALLNTIDPALLGTKGLNVDQVEIELEENVITSDAQEVMATGGTGTKLCTDVASCKALCVSTNNGKKYNGNPDGVMNPSQVKSFDNISYVTKQPGCKNCTASPNLIASLNKIKTQTDILVANKSIPNRNYGFVVVSAYRPTKDQIRVMCGSIDKNPDGLGKKYAFPALSNHGVGTAVDFYFTWDGKRVTNCGATRSEGTIEKILDAAGFHRLSNESWHFQTEGGKGTCKYPNCVEPTYCSL